MCPERVARKPHVSGLPPKAAAGLGGLAGSAPLIFLVRYVMMITRISLDLCLCHTSRSGWEGSSGGEVQGLVGAECRAHGIGRLELLLAETGAHLGEAVLAVARFKLLPRLPGWVEEGLRDAVEHGRPAPGCQS